MEIKVGTINKNNLFSRFNFQAEVSDLASVEDSTVNSSIEFQLDGTDLIRVRKFVGRLVKGKAESATAELAERVKRIDLDVVAVQEVEDIDTLREFNRDHLDGLYPHIVLLEGNDPRLIDVGVMSKLPIGAVTSWQRAVHPDKPNDTVFGRDVLQVEIMNASRSKVLFTLFNNHLKSAFVPFNEDQQAGQAANDARRKRQAEVLAKIVKDQTRPNSRYIITGDMNTPPDSPQLVPLVEDSELGLVNGLSDPEETRDPKPETNSQDEPTTKAWTHRFKKSGEPPKHELLDHIWLSPSLAELQRGAFIDRRTKHGGDGTDHDPAWIVLEL